MNTANIKKYAPKARQDFIAAMTKQAALYGVTAKGCEPMEIRGDVALIGSRTFPKSISRARDALVKRIEQLGFAQTMEQAAYSWFNRLCAIRYMEIHGYLDHGRRVLSTASGEAGTPQILDDCLDIELPGLDKAKVADLKLDGTQDESLYRELLLAQCHALHEAMPFLFEVLDDATELLLPDNLTKTDSLIRALVSSIPEEDWQDVEIIGWLYQFYISEKKDQVIGKVVKSEDIPAATQLFTPNWIVQYLVQNSVGRQWLQTYPDSPLKDQMPYYIAPGEQPAEVQAQLDAVTPESIDPESIKVLDPACGSGHILVEAYKLLKSIYEERGYRTRDIPRLILSHNLFGLDIDDRAGQLAGFALMMLARQDDRRLFSRVASGDVSLNVLSLQETGHLDLNQLWRSLNLGGEWQQGSSQSLFESEQADLSSAKADNRYQLLERTLTRFSEAKTFGSLIEVPAEDAEPLKELLNELTQLAKEGDSMQKPAALQLLPYVQQAWVLAQRYDAVIANPPYMGSKYQAPAVKKYLKDAYKGYEKDLFSAFIIRNLALAKERGQLGFMTPFVWMFISSYEQLRKQLITKSIITSLVQLEYSGFEGATVPVCTFTLQKGHIDRIKGCFIRLSNFRGANNQGPKTLEAIRDRNCGWFFEAAQDEFNKMPESPVAYWVGESIKKLFINLPSLSSLGEPRRGLQPGNTLKNVRFWQEVSLKNSSFNVDKKDVETVTKEIKWVGFSSGGGFRKWAGNLSHVVNWYKNGHEIKNGHNPIVPNESLYFREAISWSKISSGSPSFRRHPAGIIPGDNSPFAIVPEVLNSTIFASLNSNVTPVILQVLAPTLHFQVGDIANIPILKHDLPARNVGDLISIAEQDWNSYERSWDFQSSPLILDSFERIQTIESSYEEWINRNRSDISKMKRLEEENNRVFINAYGLENEISPEVPIEQITLTINPAYRYGGSLNTNEVWERFLEDSMCELVSYAIGCMMGRYSIDKTGLILASQGETLQDYLSQIPSPRFMPDDDAILPLNDQEWFADDATNRFREFVRVVWGDEHLQENLDFVAESLCLHAIKAKRGESALDTIRRYLSTQFYKNHMRTYKKRPIYWLFSSGKHKAFECLVYLHRYNEGTLARMRTEYVIPLSSKLAAYADKLEQDKAASASAAETKRLEKEINTLHKQQAELAEFDEKLRHYADQRIALDLDDGVKVNYGKFGDLLANVKEVTGKAPS